KRQRQSYEHCDRARTKCCCCLIEPAIHSLDGEPDCPHHQRQAHYGGSECSASPAEGENDAAALVEESAEGALPAEGEEKEIAGDDRRHDQRQMHHAIENGFAGEAASR